MKKFCQPPLKIDCSCLSKKRAMSLADDLVDLFDTVEYWGDEIVCHNSIHGFRIKGFAVYALNRSALDRIRSVISRFLPIHYVNIALVESLCGIQRPLNTGGLRVAADGQLISR